jgi:hypothetical protein
MRKLISKYRDTEYHDRLEQEVTSLRRDLVEAEHRVTKLEFDLKQSRYKEVARSLENRVLQDEIDHIKRIKLDVMETNTQLRQAIAVLNDEPTNSL